jgi:hypothetical protein
MAKKVIKEVDAHVGYLVRERRKAIGMSQEKLGEASRFSRSRSTRGAPTASAPAG